MPNIIGSLSPEEIAMLTSSLIDKLTLEEQAEIVITNLLWTSGGPTNPVIRASDDTSIMLFERVYDVCVACGIHVSPRRYSPSLSSVSNIALFGSMADIDEELTRRYDLVPSTVTDLQGDQQPFCAIWQSTTPASDKALLNKAIVINDLMGIEFLWRGPYRQLTFHSVGTFRQWLELQSA